MSMVTKGGRKLSSRLRCVVLEDIEPSWLDSEGYVSNLPFPYLSVLNDPSICEAQGTVTSVMLASAKSGTVGKVLSNRLYKVRIMDERIIQELPNGRRAEITPAELGLYESMTSKRPYKVYYRYVREGAPRWVLVKEYKQVRYEPSVGEVPATLETLVRTVDHWISRRVGKVTAAASELGMGIPADIQEQLSADYFAMGSFAMGSKVSSLFWVDPPHGDGRVRRWIGSMVPTGEELACYAQARVDLLEGTDLSMRPDRFSSVTWLVQVQQCRRVVLDAIEDLLMHQQRLVDIVKQRRLEAFA